LDQTLDECFGQIDAAVEQILGCYRNNGGVFVFGNGGSAADAQHIVGELNGRFLKERKPLKAQALVGDAATMTCISNDYGYEQIFSRQLEANGVAGDVAWGLTTSGNSPNVVNALKTAREKGIRTMAMTGQGGGLCVEYAEVLIAIPSSFTPHVQEVGLLIYHCICEKVESEFRAR